MENGEERKDGGVSEEIRRQRKVAKQLKKLEKKSKREEEFLRNLRKPKSTKILLADRIFFEKLSNDRSKNSTEQSFELSSSDFPELSPATTPGKPKPVKISGVRHEIPVKSTVPSTGTPLLPENPPQVVKATHPETVQPKKPSEITQTQSLEVKRTEKENPAVLNLGDLMVNKPPKKKKKREMRSGLKLQRLHESNTLCGNLLDSSNPKRYRGKHCEIKKRTFTKLKLGIIHDRIFSRKARESKSRVDEMDPEKLKLELDLYLSDLMKQLQLAKAERIGKSINPEEKNEIVSEIESGKSVKKGKRRKITIYRKYCDNNYSEDLDNAVKALIQRVVYLQDRAFVRNPIKAKAKPRHVVGLRQVKKYLMLHKLKMIIVAPDLEAQETVFNAIEELKSCSYSQNVLCVFALNRRQLGYASMKGVPVSAFGILSYDGLEDKFAAVKEKLKEAQDLLKSSQTAMKPPSKDSNIPA